MDSPSATEYEYTRPDAVPVKKVSEFTGATTLIADCGAYRDIDSFPVSVRTVVQDLR